MLAVLLLYVPAGPLVPALHSYWLVIHVMAAIVATGAFAVGAIAASLFLVKERAVARGSIRAGGYLDRLPELAALDRLSYRVHAFGFPIWTFAALIAGPIWAEYAWGSYWNWDPKEVWAFITWVVYAAYLHARATAGWKGRRGGDHRAGRASRPCCSTSSASTSSSAAASTRTRGAAPPPDSSAGSPGRRAAYRRRMRDGRRASGGVGLAVEVARRVDDAPRGAACARSRAGSPGRRRGRSPGAAAAAAASPDPLDGPRGLLDHPDRDVDEDREDCDHQQCLSHTSRVDGDATRVPSTLER